MRSYRVCDVIIVGSTAFNPNTQVWGNGPSCCPSSSCKPCGDFGPIAWLCTVARSAAPTGTETPIPDGTTPENRQSTRWLWSYCTAQQRAGTGNRLCIFHLRWPMMRRPIWNHTATLALGEMWWRSSSGTSLRAHHPRKIWSRKGVEKKKKGKEKCIDVIINYEYLTREFVGRRWNLHDILWTPENSIVMEIIGGIKP